MKTKYYFKAQSGFLLYSYDERSFQIQHMLKQFLKLLCTKVPYLSNQRNDVCLKTFGSQSEIVLRKREKNSYITLNGCINIARHK